MNEYSKVVNILSTPGVLSDKYKENYYLGVAFFYLGDYDGAINSISRYVKYHNKHYEPFWRLGYAYYMKGMYDEALQAYMEAKKLNPTSSEIKEAIDLCIKNLGVMIH